MPMSDVTFTCPKCHRRLVYVERIDGTPPTHIYKCPIHGRWRLMPDLDFRPMPSP
jgi:hypothetical protein